ncbi:DUF4468 domain-containing protein [Pedobacter sp. L105]|uniref:DUF4468 domain-containing protein n=1 Tax=Pedobacter sp. L105 TaxID=1641871 RepID=UPI00131AE43F|nr:DUF4468 domain-containing protein [Pedobacter sp. L105]
MNKRALLQKQGVILLFLFFSSLAVNAQDAISWTVRNNGSKVADTVALEDYLPVSGGIVYEDVVIELPGVTKQELYSRAKLAVQKTFTGNKLGSSNYDPESGIVSVNNFYDISDMTALNILSSNPAKDTYYFNAMLSIIVKEGKYKIKMEIPDYSYGQLSKYKSYADFKSGSLPISTLANQRQNMKRQRMRVLKTLNEKMLTTFNLVRTEMYKKLDTDF